MQLAPNEIIIIDFHRFPYPSNFNVTLHDRFVAIIERELGDLAVPASLAGGGLRVDNKGGPTLGEIWAQNKNFIISYGDKVTANKRKNEYYIDIRNIHNI